MANLRAPVILISDNLRPSRSRRVSFEGGPITLDVPKQKIDVTHTLDF